METFTAKQYLQIDIANNFGLDKLDWQERLEWFDQNEPHLLSLLPRAENKALFYAGVKAWEKTKKGEPTGYTISLDATSSGIQILSVLTGDLSAATISNVVDSGRRRDAYMELYQTMAAMAGEEANLNRTIVKDAVMTAYYGSELEPQKAFGVGTPLLQAFYDTMKAITPAAWEFNRAMLAFWDPTVAKHSWVLPDNFHAHIKVMDKVEEEVEFLGDTFTVHRLENRPIPKGRSLGANLTHSVDGFIVRELVRRCDYDPDQIRAVYELLSRPSPLNPPETENSQMVEKLWELYQQSGYLSFRILDYLDESSIHLVNRIDIQEMLATIPKKPFKVVPTHDCFRCHPNYGNDLRRQYNLQLYLIARSNLLQFILEQMLGQPMPINKLEDFATDILDSNYALS